ncbi:winged helix-turn-helix transcriptional regulator [Actinoplanes sp. NPDC026623]|uniref:winged helix-turn-helix transcriptional regulator n=1 Tax=Actinoplanes sp. NPDC026623 TaxID=3155610 RepID=UPI0033DF1704
MSVRRGYGEACPVAHALDMIGDRWALLVVRELRLGPKRYTDLQLSLPHVGPAVLAQRLRELEQAGVVRRRALPPPAATRVYELTEWGQELEPVFGELARWGLRSPVVQREGELSADSVVLALRTFFEPPDKPLWTAMYELRLGRDCYRVRVDGGYLVEVARGELSGAADATLECDRMTLHALLNKTLSVTAAVTSGELRLTGSTKAVHLLLDAVRKEPRPVPTGPAARARGRTRTRR